MERRLPFSTATGLRAAELVALRREHWHPTPEGVLLRVLGKGRKARQVVVPSSAVQATTDYLASRGLDWASCPPETPLVAAVDPITAAGAAAAAISYSALSQSLKALVRRAARRLPPADGARLARASLHWLRHTHATRAAEAGVPIDVLQEQLGQADPRTTAGYYRAQTKRRLELLERAFGRPG
jgi:integrase